MAKIKYIYLDDDLRQAEGIASSLKNNQLEIIAELPKNYSEQIKSMQNYFTKKNTKNIMQGIIFDLRLSIKGNGVDFAAAGMAQQLRSLAAENEILDIPIILCSVDSKLKQSYNNDLTSHDLFDYYIDKKEISSNKKIITEKLISLVKGYQKINDLKKTNREITDLFDKILNLKEKKIMDVEPRLLIALSPDFPTHEFARFVLKEIIEAQGLLIDETMLGAYLGVDIAKVKLENWKKILTSIKPFKYTGIFSDAWPRWWAEEIKIWWKKLKNCPGALLLIDAQERVDFLNKTFKLQLLPATPIEKNYHTCYNTICVATKKPLDVMDALLVKSEEPKTWQQAKYISFIAALKGSGGYEVHPVDQVRYHQLKNGNTK